MEHLQHGSARLGAEVVRLEDSSLPALGQGMDGCPEAPAQDFGVIAPGYGLRVRGWVGAVAALDLRFCIVNQGSELALVPEVHPVRETLPDVPCTLDSWCCL